MDTRKKKHNHPCNGLSQPQRRGKTIKTVQPLTAASNKEQSTFKAYHLCKKKKTVSWVAYQAGKNNNLTAGRENNNQPVLTATNMIQTKQQSTSVACSSHSKQQQSKKQSSFVVACNGQSKKKTLALPVTAACWGERMKL